LSEAARAAIERNLNSISEEEKKSLKIPAEIKAYRGKGCPKCGGTGTKGRIGIFEVLFIGDDVVNLLGDRVEEEELRKVAKKQGMLTMKQDGVVKVLQGVTTLEEIERVTEEGFLEIDQ
jgi:type IV pilus assembly protein PilB